MKKVLSRLMFPVLVLVVFSLSLPGCSSGKPQYGLGLLLEEKLPENVPVKARLVSRDYESLPLSVSLYDYTPTPESQGSYGNCVAWASSYCAMTVTDSVGLDRTSRSKNQQEAFSPYFLYRKANPFDIAADNGMYLYTAMEFLKETGVPYRNSYEKSVEFGDFDISKYNGSRLYKIQDYSVLFENDGYIKDTYKITSIKKALSEYHPVVIGFDVVESFFKVKKADWKPSSRESKVGGHAMVVVAYDDNRNGGSFQIMNSWGTDWGKNGYVWVNYDDFMSYTHSAYEVQRTLMPSPGDDPGNDPSPLPDNPIPEPQNRREIKTLYSGSMEFVLKDSDEEINFSFDEENKCYVSKKSYGDGTYFRMYLTNTKPCYMYAFASDEATGTVSPIFPLNGQSALLNYSSNTVCYPEEPYWIQMDGVEGTDYMVVIYSLQELDLDELMEGYKNAAVYGHSGYENFYSRVQKALSVNQALDPVQFCSRTAVQFSASSRDYESVLPVLIAINHKNR